MSANWKTVRVFISSTFKDMQAERDHLVRFVFPKLRGELLKWRVHLEDVDLRWGVTSDQDAFDLCMKEIDRCHPRFICMLGWRYGWVPPPKAIPAEVFVKVLAGTSAAGTLKSSEDEALRGIYSPVEVDGKFHLKPKPKTTDELNAYRAHCEVAVSVLQVAEHPDAKRSITASEIHHGALDHLNRAAFRTFYIRKGNPTAKIPATCIEKPDTRAATYLGDLKAKIKNPATQSKVLVAPGLEELRPLTWHEYPWDWDEPSQRITQLEEFGKLVHTDIIASVKAEFGDIPKYEPAVTDEEVFAEEAEQMEAFIEEHTRKGRYVVSSRDTFLMPELVTFATTDSAPNILVLTGAPGSGKSAFLAKFKRELSAHHPSSFILPHFIGVSAGSTEIRRTLLRLCHKLAPLAGNTEPPPQDIKELIPHFQKLLTAAAKKQRIILILDALNQFDTTEGAHWLNWLPSDLPTNVRILASVITSPDGQPEHQTLAILRQRHARIEPLEPLKEHDSRAILTDFLDRYSKHLTEAQIAAILAKPDSKLPLYLLVILEELRTLGTDEQLTALSTNPIAPEKLALLRRDDHDKILQIFIEKELPDTALELFRWILIKRLPQDQFLSKNREEAAALVGKFAACLAASRHGLSETELAAILTPAPDGKNDPLGNVAALLRLLRPYLMRRGELLDFYHSQFREAAKSVYLEPADQKREAHGFLAEYFLRSLGELPKTPPEELRQRNVPIPRIRCHRELPWQLMEAGEWVGLSDYLSDERNFVEAWICNDYETKGYWRAVEANSDVRFVDAFRHVIDRPHLAECGYSVGVLLFETGNYDEAGSLFESLVEVAKNPVERGYASDETCPGYLRSSLSMLAAVRRRQNRPDEAAQAYEKCEKLSREAGDEVGVARALAGRANVLDYQGAFQKALALYEEAERLSRTHRVDVTTLLLNQASCLMSLGRTEEAWLRSTSALEASRASGDAERESHATAMMAEILRAKGEFNEALKLYQEVEPAFRRIGDASRLASVLCHQASIHKKQGRIDEALRYFREADTAASKLVGGRADIAATARIGLADTLYSKGDVSAAMQLYRKIEEESSASGDQKMLARAMSGQLAILLALNELAAAFHVAGRAEAICRAIGDDDCLQRVIGNKAIVFLRRGDFNRAIDSLREQETLCQPIGDRESLARCWGNQAAARLGGNHGEEAIELLLKQKSLLEDMDLKREMADCLHNLGTALLQMGRFEAVIETLPGYEVVLFELRLWLHLVNSLAMQAIAYAQSPPPRLNLAAAKAKATEALAIARAHRCESQAEYACRQCEEIVDSV